MPMICISTIELIQWNTDSVVNEYIQFENYLLNSISSTRKYCRFVNPMIVISIEPDAHKMLDINPTP